jgi:hypothetical protein
MELKSKSEVNYKAERGAKNEELRMKWKEVKNEVDG